MVMTLLERIEYLQKVWNSLIPHIPAPPPEDTARWCNYSNRVVEQAILRTAKKFSQRNLAGLACARTAPYRYTTATAKSIAERNRSTETRIP